MAAKEDVFTGTWVAQRRRSSSPLMAGNDPGYYCRNDWRDNLLLSLGPVGALLNYGRPLKGLWVVNVGEVFFGINYEMMIEIIVLLYYR